MSDFEILKALQSEFIFTLEERKKVKGWIPRTCCRAKIHRRRLQIQEVMLRIEHKCWGSFKRAEGESWE